MTCFRDVGEDSFMFFTRLVADCHVSIIWLVGPAVLSGSIHLHQGMNVEVTVTSPVFSSPLLRTPLALIFRCTDLVARCLLGLHDFTAQISERHASITRKRQED